MLELVGVENAPSYKHLKVHSVLYDEHLRGVPVLKPRARTVTTSMQPVLSLGEAMSILIWWRTLRSRAASGASSESMRGATSLAQALSTRVAYFSSTAGSSKEISTRRGLTRNRISGVGVGLEGRRKPAQTGLWSNSARVMWLSTPNSTRAQSSGRGE